MVKRENLVTLRPGDTVQRATEKMARANVSSVIIEENGKIKGIVTSHDIINIISDRKSAGLSKPMSQIMSKSIISIEGKKSKNDAIKLMEEKGVHHLFVTEGKDNIVGIISSIDLVEEISLDLKAHPWIRN